MFPVAIHILIPAGLVSETPVQSVVSNPCFGLPALGSCTYNPAAPFSIYFSLGEAIGALGFTLAVQQLLKPIYRFRLAIRHLSLGRLYICVFVGAFAAMVAATLPNLPFLHAGPWGYPIVWEILAALLFGTAYGSVAVAVVRPVHPRAKTIVEFSRNAANLLSSANEQDHIDFVNDLQHSLPVLIQAAGFAEYLRDTTAFFDFIYRKEIERAVYASSFLRIIADPAFCETLVKRTPWRVVWMLRELAAERLHTRRAEQFIQELARQAIVRDDSMMAREVGYKGFGTAPLLSDSLFSELFILEKYNPFDSLSGDSVTAQMMRRFNSAAERCFATLIETRTIHHSQAAFSIHNFYRSAFMSAWKIQEMGESDYHLPIQLHNGVSIATRMAGKLLSRLTSREYDQLYVNDPKQYRSDVLETFVEIVYEALACISNKFKGFDDPFWMTGIDVFHEAIPSIGEQPDGMSPFQQRLTLKIIEKLDDNMNGFYPAICRVLLACVGPYERNAAQRNRTAFNILRDAMYHRLQNFPQLAAERPDKVRDYLPDNVTYDTSTTELTHTYRGGEQVVTKLSGLNLGPVSLVAQDARRAVKDRDAASDP
jgi:hypothetical protein